MFWVLVEGTGKNTDSLAVPIKSCRVKKKMWRDVS